MSSVAQQNIPDIEYVKEIAFYAGEMIAKNIENRGKSVNTKKGKSDLVTETDVAVEAYLKKKISTKYPDHGFLCEGQSGPRTAHQGCSFHENAACRCFLLAMGGLISLLLLSRRCAPPLPP
eukprot:GHVU01026276.1.p2 GENE.GHVU01026276.1~~GHVU01026276.1.p2  ORF type:complete len:121 (+),score=16.33 GHVU01026276.1:75-437(+)